MSESVTLRETRPEDFKVFLAWMCEAGWIVNENMCKATLQWDPHGWLVAVDKTGEIVGTIAGTSLDDDTASICMFIVHPQGGNDDIKQRLWDGCVKLFDQKNLVYNAIKSTIQFYMDNGFLHQSFSMRTFSGPVRKEGIDLSQLDGVEFVRYTEDMLPDLAAYDATVHQIPRPIFLKQFLNPVDATTVLAKRGGRVIGYGSFQRAPKTSKFQHVGPVLAEDDVTAKALFNRLFSLIPEGDVVTIDTQFPPPTATKEIFQLHGLESPAGGPEIVRLYSKTAIDLPLHKVYAITTLGTSNV